MSRCGDGRSRQISGSVFRSNSRQPANSDTKGRADDGGAGGPACSLGGHGRSSSSRRSKQWCATVPGLYQHCCVSRYWTSLCLIFVQRTAKTRVSRGRVRSSQRNFGQRSERYVGTLAFDNCSSLFQKVRDRRQKKHLGEKTDRVWHASGIGGGI